MSVRLGTVAPIGFHDFPPPIWLPALRGLGCTVVQVYRNKDAGVSRREMREALAAGGLPCDSLHGIFGELFDPSSPVETARRFAVDTYKAEGELAKELGGPLVVVHCSTVRTQGIPAEERRKRLAQLQKSMYDLGMFGQDIGVRYAFENLPPYHAIGADLKELADAVEKSGAPNIGLCLDTGHANIIAPPAEAVPKADGKIIYVHLNDNRGGADDHLMPGEGTADLEGLAKALHEARYDGTLMLEVFHDLEGLRKAIDGGCRERIRRLLDLANGADAAPGT